MRGDARARGMGLDPWEGPLPELTADRYDTVAGSILITIPNGEAVRFPVRVAERRGDAGYAAVIKDGGDDPDCTHRAEHWAEVRLRDDGAIELKVASIDGHDVICEVIIGGTLKERKGVNVPGSALRMPSITDKDKADLKFALEQEVDFIALSYVKSADDIKELRELIASADPTVGICAKIETREAVKDLNAIIAAVDLIMVARGDMGLQMDPEDVPPTQKKIIDRCG